MQVEAFRRGDMAALGAAVDECLPWVWRLVARGFTMTDNGVPMYVRGIERLDLVEQEVEAIIAACLQPEPRSAIDGRGALDRALLQRTKTILYSFAERTGELVDIQTEAARAGVPEQVQDLDRLIAEGATPSAAVLAPDPGRRQDAEAFDAVRVEFDKTLDDRSRELIARRYGQGETRAEVAAAFTCGVAAVTERENRVRRKLGHAIRRAHPAHQLGPAMVDAVFAGALLDPLPPRVTIERLRTNILRRVHQDAPRPFGTRAAWAAAVATIAFGLWLLMFLRFLPYYGDDFHPEPVVTAQCEGPCSEGSKMTVSVLAPRDAKEVGIASLQADGSAKALLVGPGRATIGLPFGARDKAVPIPYSTTAPKAGTALVAVFTNRHLSHDEIVGAAENRIAIDGVLTASTTVGSQR